MTNPPNPFPGPVPLTDEDRIFGRGSELRQLIDLITADRFVLLYSPSGAGKSSLLNAGLVREWKARGLSFRGTVRVGGASAVKGLNRYVASCFDYLKAPASACSQLVDCLPAPVDTEELIIFDQFEEIITADPHGDEAERLEFFRQLGALLRVPGRSAVFAVREDYLAPLDQYLDWMPNRLSSRMRINVLTAKNAAEAIAGAVAETKTVVIQPAAAKAIVNDLAVGGWVEPVQLQVVCQRLWAALPDTTEVTAEMIENGGKKYSAETALEDYYSDKVAEVAKDTGVSERQIRDWFEKKMISASGTRLQAEIGLTATADLANWAADKLEAVHLLRTDERLNRRSREITHDRLIAPIRESNRAWRASNLSTLQRETELWIDTGRAPDRVMGGSTLREAAHWAQKNILNSDEKEYLRRSFAARVKRRVVAAGVVACLLAAAAAVFEAEQARLAQRSLMVEHLSQEAIRRSQETPYSAAAVALESERALTGSPTIRSGQTSAVAVRGALLAATALRDPRYVAAFEEQGADCLWMAPDHSTVMAGKAGANQAIYRLQAQSGKMVTHDGPAAVPCAAPALSIFARRDDMPDGWTVFRQPDKLEFGEKRGNSVVPHLTPNTGDVWRAAIDPTGRRAAWLVRRSNYLYLLDLRTGKAWTLPAGDLQPVCMRFSPDGNILAVGGRDQMIRLWYFPEAYWYAPVPARPLHAHTDTVVDLLFSDSHTLVSAGADNRVVVWKIEPEFAPPLPGTWQFPVAFVPGLTTIFLRPGELAIQSGGKERTVPMGIAPGIALSRNGRTAALALPNGSFQMFDANSLEQSVKAPQAGGKAFAVSDDGARVAASYETGVIRIWQNQGLSPPRMLQESNAAPGVYSLAFSPDGQELAAGDERNNIRIWRVGSAIGAGPAVTTRQTPLLLAFNAMGDMLASVDEGNNLQFWNVSAGALQSLGGSVQMPGMPRAIGFGSDGKVFHILMQPGMNASLKLRDLELRIDPANLHDAACRMLMSSERDRYGCATQ